MHQSLFSTLMVGDFVFYPEHKIFLMISTLPTAGMVELKNVEGHRILVSLKLVDYVSHDRQEAVRKLLNTATKVPSVGEFEADRIETEKKLSAALDRILTLERDLVLFKRESDNVNSAIGQRDVCIKQLREEITKMRASELSYGEEQKRLNKKLDDQKEENISLREALLEAAKSLNLEIERNQRRPVELLHNPDGSPRVAKSDGIAIGQSHEALEREKEKLISVGFSPPWKQDVLRRKQEMIALAVNYADIANKDSRPMRSLGWHFVECPVVYVPGARAVCEVIGGDCDGGKLQLRRLFDEIIFDNIKHKDFALIPELIGWKILAAEQAIGKLEKTMQNREINMEKEKRPSPADVEAIERRTSWSSWWIERMTKLRFEIQDLQKQFFRPYPTGMKDKVGMENALGSIQSGCDRFIKGVLEGPYGEK